MAVFENKYRNVSKGTKVMKNQIYRIDAGTTEEKPPKVSDRATSTKNGLGFVAGAASIFPREMHHTRAILLRECFLVMPDS